MRSEQPWTLSQNKSYKELKGYKVLKGKTNTRD